MPLIRLVAPLAAALVFGATQDAVAAQLTVDIPGCSQVALSGSGSNYTITCTQSAMTCVAQASSTTPTGGTPINLTVACAPAATSVAWNGSRDCATPTSTGLGTATVSEAVGGRSCVYSATATAPGLTGSASVAVVWQGSSTAVAPTGCSITRTPSSGSLPTTGGAISLSAACSGGGAVNSWSWRKNAATGWSSAQAPSDSLPANTGSAAVTYTYGITACSNGACAAEVTTTFTVAGSAPVGFCSQYSSVKFVNLNFGDPPVDTSGGVGLNPGDVIVARITVPAGAASPGNIPGTFSVVEYQGPTANRILSLSSQPCDFRGWTPGSNFPPSDPTGANTPMGWSGGINPNIQFLLQGDPAGFPPRPLLNPGQQYYLNLRTINFGDGQNSCTNPSCDVRFTTNIPQ